MKFVIHGQDKSKWSIPAESLPKALAGGGTLDEAYSGQKFKVKAADGEEWLIPGSSLKQAFEMGGELTTPGFTDHVQGFMGGIAEKVGKIADIGVALGGLTAGGIAQGASTIADKVGATGVANNLNGFADKSYTTAKDYWNNPKIEQRAKDEWETGFEHDKGVAIAKAGGSLAPEVLPFSWAGKGVQLLSKTGAFAKMPWVGRLSEFLAIDVNAKNAGAFAGAGAGAELAKSDDPNTSELENVGREIIGSIAGAVTVPAAGTKALNALYKLTTTPPKTLVAEISANKFAKKYGGKTDEKVVDIASKHDLPLTPALATDSVKAAFTENNKLRSQYASEAWKAVIDNTDETVIDKFKDTVLKDTLGLATQRRADESLGKTLSDSFKDQTLQNSQAWTKASNDKYQLAKSIATEVDVLAPNKTLKEIDTLLEDLSYGDKTNAAKNSIINTLTEFKAGLVNNQMSLRDLLGWATDLSERSVNGESYTKLLGKISHTIKSEIDEAVGKGISNKDFVKLWKEAQSYNKEMIQTRIKTDMARSILSQESPKEAIAFMNSAHNVTQLSRILGADHSPKAELLMKQLKGAKIEDLLYSKNIITAEGNLNTKPFVKLFSKDNSDKDLLIALIGKENYQLAKQDFVPYIEKLGITRGTLKNTSNTANVQRDYNLDEQASGLVKNTVIGAAVGSLKGPGTAALGATAGAANSLKASWQMRNIRNLSESFMDKRKLEAVIEHGKMPNKGIKAKILDASENILSKPHMLYNGLKPLLNNGLPAFDRDKFLEDVKDSTDRSSFIFTPEEMKKMRKK